MKHKKVLGFISEYDGRLLTFKEYFEAVEKGDEPGALPVAVLEGIKKLVQEHEAVDGLRVTSLLGCLRNTYYSHKLGNTSEYVKPSDYYAMFRGVIAHKVMEGFKRKGAIDEKRFYKKWRGIKIAGKPDRIIPAEKELDDYKTTKKVPEWSNKPYSFHEQQLNIYRWLISDEYEIDKLKVIYLDMSTAKECFGRIYSDEEFRDFMDSKVLVLKNCLDKNIVPKYEKSWQCDYCNYNVECRKDLVGEMVDELATRLEEGGSVTKTDINKLITKLK